ncbi:transcriptional regulator CadC [Vibrio inusitatus NBRC 102082]|uniref:Transcriptional regulator CadC n=1 Tax=Vibrio inusitatus NBRC 102082 TaxID=1219070 RepID=A0A4Y3HWV3_9VIBR|nr:winged helix-turn-helix domain-containing protein [Vibrio inusitatus]GEA51606.1 transcriptional regulator CadC [Vibrio inusitatus NBRC 102082]
MKENKVHYKVGEWLFIPYEDKFILDGKDFLIEKRLSNLFLFLCQHPHQIFSRDELINEVWHGMILTDQVITQAIFELRKILKKNGEHPFGYIVTVSKRGYKLDSDVEIIEVAQRSAVITKASESETSSPEPIISDTEEQPNSLLESKAVIHIKEPKPRSALLRPMLAFVLLVTLSIAASYLNQRHKLLAAEGTQAIPAPTYLSYEPRYIQVVYSANMKGHNLGKGLSMYILRQVKFYKDFRIISEGDIGELAANVVKLDVVNNNGHDYLNIKFSNRVSGATHLNRKYSLNSSELNRSINLALDDILDSFNIDISKKKLAQTINELPKNMDALKYTLSGFATSSGIAQSDDVLMNLSRSLQIEPDNQYTYSMNYMLTLINMYLLKEQSMDKEIMSLNKEHEATLKQFYTQDNTSYRTLEALAVLALSKDLPLDARKYLKEIPYNQRTVIYYLASAKLSELSGYTSAAEEYYQQAMIESDSSEMLSIGEVVFFNSSLTNIKQKLKASTL